MASAALSAADSQYVAACTPTSDIRTATATQSILRAECLQLLRAAIVPPEREKWMGDGQYLPVQTGIGPYGEIAGAHRKGRWPRDYIEGLPVAVITVDGQYGRMPLAPLPSVNVIIARADPFIETRGEFYVLPYTRNAAGRWEQGQIVPAGLDFAWEKHTDDSPLGARWIVQSPPGFPADLNGFSVPPGGGLGGAPGGARSHGLRAAGSHDVRHRLLRAGASGIALKSGLWIACGTGCCTGTYAE